ncbi:MAG: hypothetical protein C0408_01700 [Odoribacter sp.]|nr:hypothetical protein [Odoribacter sp.]
MKNKRSGFSRLTILLLFILFFISCTPESCFENTTSMVNATFYKAGTYKPLAPDSITVFGIGKEINKLYSKSTKLTVIQLPLNASSESCGFVIKINDITDTIKFTYSGFPHLISMECGITFHYTLNSHWKHGSTIDSIKIINSNITTFSEENIRIYY